MVRRILSAGVGLMLLAVGGGSLLLILRALPAFDQDARVSGLFGDWRVPVASALYNRSDYLFQIGFGLLQSDLVSSAATEERDELASIDVALERAGRARRALEASAALAPGNAYTWTFLGWAAAMEGDIEDAESALATSWTLAPWSLQLAPLRLNLFELLVELDAIPAARAGSALGAIRDLEMLRSYDARSYGVLVGGGGILKDLVASATTD